MLLTEVQACIGSHQMLSQGARVITAVSGGPDSMALLAALHQLREAYDLTLFVAYVHHQLRGEEADREVAFVAQQAAQRGIPFYYTHIDVEKLRRTSGLSRQHAARHLRYHFLHWLYDALGATSVALGHTADDQAETLLVRLLRGSGLTGMAGIPAVRWPFIRPLLTTRRETILSYLRSIPIPWVEDSSNTHRDYLRNCVRLDVLPFLQQYNPQIVKGLNTLANIARADNTFLEEQVEAWSGHILLWRGHNRVCIQCMDFRTAPLAIQRRLLRRTVDALVMPPGVAGFAHCEALRQLILAGRVGQRLTLPGQIVAERRYEDVLIGSGQSLSAVQPPLVLPVPGMLEIAQGRTTLTTEVYPHPCNLSEARPWRVFLDLDTLRHPLIVRFWQPGDRFHPLGAPGRKKLQDFFVDQKVPRVERAFVPLVVSGAEIIWIVGYQIANSCKIGPQTARVVCLQYHNPQAEDES